MGAQESVEAAVGNGVPQFHAAVGAAAREVLAVRREPERRKTLSNARRGVLLLSIAQISKRSVK